MATKLSLLLHWTENKKQLNVFQKIIEGRFTQKYANCEYAGIHRAANTHREKKLWCNRDASDEPCKHRMIINCLKREKKNSFYLRETVRHTRSSTQPAMKSQASGTIFTFGTVAESWSGIGCIVSVTWVSKRRLALADNFSKLMTFTFIFMLQLLPCCSEDPIDQKKNITKTTHLCDQCPESLQHIVGCAYAGV